MIELQEVEKHYGRVRALAGVSLRVPAGAVYGLIGPNGAGKTTALRLIAGLSRPTRGAIRVAGVDARRGGAGRAMVGYLPQRVEVNRLATVREVLDLFARLRNLEAAAVERAVAEGGLREECDRRVAELSGGMRQRLGLAIARLGDPPILLLDEPNAGLDPRAVIELRRYVRRLADEGRTVVISSHSLAELELVCDRLVVLVEGRVVLEGALDALKQANGHRSLDELFMEATA